MNKIRALLVGAVIAATTAVAAPLATAAAEPAPVAPHEVVPQADGRLHVYYGFNLSNHCGSWVGSDDDWGVCRNATASLWNNGYPGNLDDVRVYWGVNQTGASRGVYNGVALGDLRNWTFDNNGSGAGEWLYNNISSHQWVNLP